MTRLHQIIYLQPDAPNKPAWGDACNGCGVCCLAEPCPLGQLVSGRRRGACDALRWDAEHARYRCGVVADPQGIWPRLPAPAVPLARRLALRWIGAGGGCDADLVPLA
ncbi:MAG: hypothetical protein AD742_13300 [Methylibium sp. NZG]|nr:MAG: hypothetical protein AD742_13300 [Methylibium sp. NZG]